MVTLSEVINILYEGTDEEIIAVRCPECGNEFWYQYYPETRNFETECYHCGMMSRAHGSHSIPNCYHLQKAKENPTQEV